jgi:hypothetical protein
MIMYICFTIASFSFIVSSFLIFRQILCSEPLYCVKMFCFPG